MDQGRTHVDTLLQFLQSEEPLTTEKRTELTNCLTSYRKWMDSEVVTCVVGPTPESVAQREDVSIVVVQTDNPAVAIELIAASAAKTKMNYRICGKIASTRVRSVSTNTARM